MVVVPKKGGSEPAFYDKIFKWVGTDDKLHGGARLMILKSCGIRKCISKVALLVLLVSEFGCMSDEYRQFLQLPKEAQEKRFVTLPLSKQVDYVEYCNTFRTCEGFYYDEIAVQGKAALPYLFERMRASDDLDKFKITIVLRGMNEKYYKICDEADVRTLHEVINTMKDRDYTDGAISELDEVFATKKNCGK